MNFTDLIQARVGAMSCYPSTLFGAMKSLDDCSIDEVLVPQHLAEEDWISPHEHRELRRVARCCHRGSDSSLSTYYVDANSAWMELLCDTYTPAGTFLLVGMDLPVMREIVSSMPAEHTVIVPTGMRAGAGHQEVVAHLQQYHRATCL